MFSHKWSNISILNNSIYHMSFVCTQLKYQTFIWPIARTLIGATLLSWEDLRAMAMKEYSVLPKAPVLLEPRHQIIYCHIQDTYYWGFYSQQRCSRYILQPQLTGPQGQLLGKSYPSVEMQSVYSTAPVVWDERMWS